MKSCGVTIQIKPFQHYIILFLSILQLGNFDLKWPLGIERVKAIGLRLSFYFNIISLLFNVILSHAFLGV